MESWNNPGVMDGVFDNEDDDPGLDAMLLEAERLATQMQSWNQSDDSSQVSDSALPDESPIASVCGGSFESSDSFQGDSILAEKEGSLRQGPLSNHVAPPVLKVEDMLQKAEALMTQMRKSNPSTLTDEYVDNEKATETIANVSRDVDEMLERAEQLAARMHSASHTSIEREEDEGVPISSDVDLLMLKKGSELSSAEYSSAANINVERPSVFCQTKEVPRHRDVASPDATVTSISLGSDMAVASRAAPRFDERGAMEHGRVAKAEEMARLMHQALSSHLPIEEANDILPVHGHEDNDIVIDRVVSALRKTTTDPAETGAADSPFAPPVQKPHDELSSVASGSMRSGASPRSPRRSKVPPPPMSPPPPPRPEIISGVPPPTVTAREQASQEQLPSEQDADFVPVADYRPNKKQVPLKLPIRQPVNSVPAIVTPPPPPPRVAAVVTADEDDFVPVADFSSSSGSTNSSGASKIRIQVPPPPRSVRWEKVKPALQNDDDFVPIMDFRKEAPKQQQVVVQQPQTSKRSTRSTEMVRRTGRRRLLRTAIMAVVIGYVAWRLLFKSSRTGQPTSNNDPATLKIQGIEPSKQSISHSEGHVEAPNSHQVAKIVWKYPEDICRLEDVPSDVDEDDGVCDITDAVQVEESQILRQEPNERLRKRPWVCKIPHLSNLLDRHCRQSLE